MSQNIVTYPLSHSQERLLANPTVQFKKDCHCIGIGKSRVEVQLWLIVNMCPYVPAAVCQSDVSGHLPHECIFCQTISQCVCP